MPDTGTMLASERGSGSGGPSVQESKLPTPESVATHTSFCAVVPSDPPMNRILVPSWTAVPSVRGPFSASLSGDWCQAVTEPRGGGQGNASFSELHRLTGDQASTPRSMVRLTVK